MLVVMVVVPDCVTFENVNATGGTDTATAVPASVLIGGGENAIAPKMVGAPDVIDPRIMTLPVVAGLILMGVGLVLFGAGIRLKDRWVRGGGLLLTLSGYFVVFSTLIWSVDELPPAVSSGVVLGAVAVFQLMSWFEPGPPRA